MFVLNLIECVITTHHHTKWISCCWCVYPVGNAQFHYKQWIKVSAFGEWNHSQLWTNKKFFSSWQQFFNVIKASLRPDDTPVGNNIRFVRICRLFLLIKINKLSIACGVIKVQPSLFIYCLTALTLLCWCIDDFPIYLMHKSLINIVWWIACCDTKKHPNNWIYTSNRNGLVYWLG